jgi:hypothetical protein
MTKRRYMDTQNVLQRVLLRGSHPGGIRGEGTGRSKDRKGDTMTIEKCTKCGNDDVIHTSWAGGSVLIKCGCECRSCGHRFYSIYNLQTQELTYREFGS